MNKNTEGKEIAERSRRTEIPTESTKNDIVEPTEIAPPYQRSKEPQFHIYKGDALTMLKRLPFDSVHCCITSPPYFQQRDYGVEGQLGQEPCVEKYVDNLVAVFHEVRRVLHPQGTLWLNLGDKYIRKNLGFIPYRVAMALQQDGWLMRGEMVWAKTAAMPESVTDRPTNAWEPIFMCAKNPSYFYDAEAVNERLLTGETAKVPLICEHGFGEKPNMRNVWTLGPEPYRGSHFAPFPTEIPRRAILAGSSEKGCCPTCLSPWKRIVERRRVGGVYGGLRKRADASGQETSEGSIFRTGAASVTKTVGWEPTCKCKSEPVPCTVLDCFGGTGTSGQVALELGRSAILIELNPEYCELARQRFLKEGRQ